MNPGERCDCLDAVVYADLFDCAVDLDEIWRYSRSRVSRGRLAKLLEEPAVGELIGHSEGYYFLAGREPLAAERAIRRKRSKRLRTRARRVARWVRHAPFVRGILLTGSVAADNAAPDSDVDFLVIVAEGRIASVFALLGSASRLLSRQLFCPNYYVSERHLTLERRDHYVAREIVQAEPLAGNGAKLRAANRWVEDHLPNAREHAFATPALPGGGALQRMLEWSLTGRVGDWLEARASKLARSRLATHHGTLDQPVPAAVIAQLEADVELRFHETRVESGLLERYEALRREASARLDKPSSPPHCEASGG